MSATEHLVSPLAGKPATPAMLVNVPRLITACYINMPDAAIPAQRVAFGTSGHRGSAERIICAASWKKHKPSSVLRWRRKRSSRRSRSEQI
jgi:hypothetical protein